MANFLRKVALTLTLANAQACNTDPLYPTNPDLGPKPDLTTCASRYVSSFEFKCAVTPNERAPIANYIVRAPQSYVPGEIDRMYINIFDGDCSNLTNREAQLLWGASSTTGAYVRIRDFETAGSYAAALHLFSVPPAVLLCAELTIDAGECFERIRTNFVCQP